ESNELAQAKRDEPEGVVPVAWMDEGDKFRIVRILGENRLPAREYRSSSRSATARGRALKDCVEQIADSVNPGELRFLNVPAKFVLKAAQNFYTLHRVETKIKFQTKRGPHRRRSRSRRFTNDLQPALHIRLFEPRGFVGGERLFRR